MVQAIKEMKVIDLNEFFFIVDGSLFVGEWKMENGE